MPLCLNEQTSAYHLQVDYGVLRQRLQKVVWASRRGVAGSQGRLLTIVSGERKRRSSTALGGLYDTDAGAHKVGLPASKRADHPTRARPVGMCRRPPFMHNGSAHYP